MRVAVFALLFSACNGPLFEIHDAPPDTPDWCDRFNQGAPSDVCHGPAFGGARRARDAGADASP